MHDAMKHNLYESAIFYGDKVLSLEGETADTVIQQLARLTKSFQYPRKPTMTRTI